MKWKIKSKLKIMHGTSRNIIPERQILFKSYSLKKDNCNHYFYLIKNYKI
jgi:hypothetical protein